MLFALTGKGAVVGETYGDILTIDELSGYLKISKSTLYKLVREGNIPCQKVGRHWRFHKDLIDKWLGTGAGNKGKVRKANG